MDAFAETAIVEHRLSFVDQGKQTSVLCFRLLQANGRCRFPLVPFLRLNHDIVTYDTRLTRAESHLMSKYQMKLFIHIQCPTSVNPWICLSIFMQINIGLDMGIERNIFKKKYFLYRISYSSDIRLVRYIKKGRLWTSFPIRYWDMRAEV